MRPFVMQILPKNIVVLSNIAALVRPGTLSAPSPDPTDPPTETAASYYVKCCQGHKKPYFIHDDLRPILSHTYGVVLFQEQTLRIFRDLAGYSYEVCEEVRRAVGKKIPAELNKHGGYLKECLLKRGWTEEQAIRLFDTIVASGSYSFNCISGDQLIQTKEGLISIKDICESKEDIYVNSYNELTKETELIIPSHKQYMGEKEVWDFVFDNGTIISLTKDHKVLTNSGWMTVDEAFCSCLEILDVSR